MCRSKAVLQSRDAKGQTCRVTGLLQLKVGESMLSGRNETSQHALSRPANAGLCVSPRGQVKFFYAIFGALMKLNGIFASPNKGAWA